MLLTSSCDVSVAGDSAERCACCRSRLNRTAAKEKSDSQITNDAVYFEICSLISTLGQNGNHYRIIAFLMTYSTNRLDTGDVKWGRIRNGQYPGKEQDSDSIFQHVPLNLRINDGKTLSFVAQRGQRATYKCVS